MFPTLFSPFEIKGHTFRNRIFSTGHQTLIVTGGLPNDGLVAYHEARAKGGAGLIITEAMTVHETAFFNEAMIAAYRDEALPGMKKITEAVHRHGTKVFGQLFHPGAEVLGTDSYGTRTIAWAPSPLNHERYFATTRQLTPELIEEIIKGYAITAERMIEAGYDGVEIVASHGYLPAQFLSPLVNQRTAGAAAVKTASVSCSMSPACYASACLPAPSSGSGFRSTKRITSASNPTKRSPPWRHSRPRASSIT